MFADRRYVSRGTPKRETSMVWMLIWTNVFIFILQFFDGGVTGNFSGFLELSPQGIGDYQLWRIGSYMFAHGSFTHLLFNMWGLYLFGGMVEQRLGGNRFLRLYFTSGFIGGLVWLLCNWHIPGPSVVGASGALFGVMTAAAMMFPNQRILLLLPPVEMPLKLFVPVYAFIEIAMLGISMDNVAHLAHLGGMLGGFLFIREHAPETWQWHFMRGIQQRWKQRGWKRVQGGSAAEQPGAPAADEVDRILDKIGSQGIGSLSDDERRTLEQARERLRSR